MNLKERAELAAQTHAANNAEWKRIREQTEEYLVRIKSIRQSGIFSTSQKAKTSR